MLTELIIRHLKKICGEPPPEIEVEIVWQDHELGQYPVIGLVWEAPMRGVPWNYISRCAAALAAYQNEGKLPPGWVMPSVHSDDDDLDGRFDPDKPPPEPPEILDRFESQRYMSKLIQWGLVVSNRARSRPHLVENDDESEDAR